AAGLAAAVALGVVVSATYFGRLGIWIDFARSLPRTLSPGTYTIDTGNFSAAALIAGSSASALGAVLLIVLTAGGIWLALRASRGQSIDLLKEAFFFAGWGAGTVLLSSPLAWLHYYMLLLPGIFGAVQSTNQDDIGSSGHWVRRVMG